MFGYVRVSAGELKVKEHEFYKGTYCGLCASLGKCTGQCSRMTLSYDFTLFALLRFALTGERVEFKQGRCLAHPFKKRNIMVRNAELDYAAYASALLSYHKVRDDIADSGFWRGLFERIFILPKACAMRRRTLRKKPEFFALDAKCQEIMEKFSSLEKEKCQSADKIASVFGELLAELISFSLSGANERIARSIGSSIGRWIYVADALDDIHDDMKTGNYNPFVEMYGGKIPSAEQVGDILLAIKNELYAVEAAVDLVDFSDNLTVKSIISNILYLGIPSRTQKIAEKFSELKG